MAMKFAKTGKFPNWEALYRAEKVEGLPWYHERLDPDLSKALSALKIKSGKALDIGTGPGTQALALAKKGFEVTATDLSRTAIRDAAKRAVDAGLSIRYRQDDILNSGIRGEFGFAFDRGCFHVLPPGKRQVYVKKVAELLKAPGYLFIKCFSVLEPSEKGPYKFGPGDIERIFSRRFTLEASWETVYQGTLRPRPKALFCILKRRPKGKKAGGPGGF